MIWPKRFNITFIIILPVLHNILITQNNQIRENLLKLRNDLRSTLKWENRNIWNVTRYLKRMASNEYSLTIPIIQGQKPHPNIPLQAKLWECRYRTKHTVLDRVDGQRHTRTGFHTGNRCSAHCTVAWATSSPGLHRQR